MTPTPSESETAPSPSRTRPRVIIVGGGFGGLATARALKHSACDVILIDRRNYTLFQPLLYQVATAALSPAQIAAPIRHVLADQKNTEVYMGEVSSINADKKTLIVETLEFSYDYLVLAAGATSNYFGQDWQQNAPGLKTIEEAIDIRGRFLLAFEQAEVETHPKSKRRALTFVIVGAGPTGVELAGAMAEMSRITLKRQYKHIDTQTVRIVLIDASERPLGSFHESLSASARRSLEKLGVELKLNARVQKVDATGIEFTKDGKNERIFSQNIIWAAGVHASPLTKTIDSERDYNGRLIVQSDLSLPKYPNLFAIGDLAAYTDPKTNELVPGVAQGAIQMGHFVGSMIAKEIKSKRFQEDMPKRGVFHYFDKGAMAIVGRYKAVADIMGFRFSGFFAFITWALVHVMFLIGFRRKMQTMAEWVWTYLFHDRGVRLITSDDAKFQVRKPIKDPDLP